MSFLQVFLVLLLTGAALIFDVSSGKIPNVLAAAGVMAGLPLQLGMWGPKGAAGWALGVLAAPAVLGVLFWFRMMGAGDIKLLCAIGALAGPGMCLRCILRSLLIGGALALVLALKRGILAARLGALVSYLRRLSRTRAWAPYSSSVPASARFPFALPVFLSVLWEVFL